MDRIELLEYTENDAESKTDFDAGIVRDVPILGCKSKNRREYTPAALQKAAPLYENIAVYIDHPGPEDAHRKGRKMADRFGSLSNVRFIETAKGAQLRGDLVYLKSHPLAPRVGEDLDRRLNFFGLSHLGDGQGTFNKEKNTMMVEAIDRVAEVDLVTNPATVVSLREQMDATEPAKETPEDKEDRKREQAMEAAIRATTQAIEAVLTNPDGEISEKRTKIEQIVAAHFSQFATEEEKLDEKEESDKEKVAEQTQTATAAAPASIPLAEQIAAAVKAAVEPLQTKLTAIEEKQAAISKRKYLPGAPQTVPLAEQKTGNDEFPASGTQAEKEAWFHRRK